MAPHASETVTPLDAPLWYRRRVIFFACAYAFGFFVGNAVPLGSGAPAAVVFGSAAGDAGIRAWLAAGAFATCLGWGVRVWGSAYLRPATVWNDRPLDDRLIVDGPFRYVRNPLYLGTLFVAAGVGLLAPPLGALVIVAGNGLLVAGLIREEERILRTRYGAVFDAYRRAVPALIPRLSPASVPDTVRATPSVTQGLLSEVLFASFALGMLAIALFGQRGVIAFYVLGVAGAIATAILRRSRVATTTSINT